MSRSTVDATRFTATSPHAYSKPAASKPAASKSFSPSSSYPRSHSLPQKTAGPLGSHSTIKETAAQKVARLRAAHDALKNAQITTWDKIVVRGRVIADKAHRFTVLSLIGFSVIAVGVTVFSLTDMIIYNRRKRKEYNAEQRMILAHMLMEAREAEAKGIADEDQILFLNREREVDEAERIQKEKKGRWRRYIKGIFSTEGLKKEDTSSGLEALGEEKPRKVGEGSLLIESAGETVTDSTTEKEETPGLGILQAVEEKRRDGERELQKRGVNGGTLDQLAEQAAAAGKSKGGWTSWFTSK